MKDVTDLAVSGLFVAVIGGIVAYLLSLMLGVAGAAVGMPAIIGGFVAVALLYTMIVKTNIETNNIFEFFLLLGVAGLVGSIITLLLPMTSGYILAFSGPLTYTGFIWTVVYVAAAMTAKEMVL